VPTGAGGSTDLLARAISTVAARHFPQPLASVIKAGRLGGLAVTFEQRDPSVPDVPTFREQGYAVVTAGSVKGFGALKGAPIGGSDRRVSLQFSPRCELRRTTVVPRCCVVSAYHYVRKSNKTERIPFFRHILCSKPQKGT